GRALDDGIGDVLESDVAGCVEDRGSHGRHSAGPRLPRRWQDDPSIRADERTQMTFHVGSEVGRLRQVIVHRPGLEMHRLTPDNRGGYLFDEILWVERAQEEHDEFVAAMRRHGVTVHYFAELLEQTLAVPEARKHVLDQSLDERHMGPLAAEQLR